MELVVLGSNTLAVGWANATLTIGIPNSASRTIGGVGGQGIVGESGTSKGGDTDAGTAWVHSEVVGERQDEF